MFRTTANSRYLKKQFLRLTQLAYYQAGKIVVQTLLPQHPPTALISLNLFGITTTTGADTYIPLDSSSTTHWCSSLESRLIGLYGGKATSSLLEYENAANFNSSRIKFMADTIKPPRIGVDDYDLAQESFDRVDNTHSKNILWPSWLPTSDFDLNLKGIKSSVTTTKWHISVNNVENNVLQSDIGNVEIQSASRLATTMVNKWNFYSLKNIVTRDYHKVSTKANTNGDKYSRKGCKPSTLRGKRVTFSSKNNLVSQSEFSFCFDAWSTVWSLKAGVLPSVADLRINVVGKKCFRFNGTFVTNPPLKTTNLKEEKSLFTTDEEKINKKKKFACLRLRQHPFQPTLTRQVFVGSKNDQILFLESYLRYLILLNHTFFETWESYVKSLKLKKAEGGTDLEKINNTSGITATTINDQRLETNNSFVVSKAFLDSFLSTLSFHLGEQPFGLRQSQKTLAFGQEKELSFVSWEKIYNSIWLYTPENNFISHKNAVKNDGTKEQILNFSKLIFISKTTGEDLHFAISRSRNYWNLNNHVVTKATNQVEKEKLSYNQHRTSIENVGNKSILRANVFQLVNLIQFSNVQRNRFYPGWFRLYLPDIEVTEFIKNVANYYFSLGLQTLTRPSLNEFNPLLQSLGSDFSTKFSIYSCFANVDLSKNCIDSEVNHKANYVTKNLEPSINLIVGSQLLVPFPGTNSPSLTPYSAEIVASGCSPAVPPGAASLRKDEVDKKKKSQTTESTQWLDSEPSEKKFLEFQRRGRSTSIEPINSLITGPVVPFLLPVLRLKANSITLIKNVFFSSGNNNLSIGVGLLRNAAKRRNQRDVKKQHYLFPQRVFASHNLLSPQGEEKTKSKTKQILKKVSYPSLSVALWGFSRPWNFNHFIHIGFRQKAMQNYALTSEGPRFYFYHKVASVKKNEALQNNFLGTGFIKPKAFSTKLTDKIGRVNRKEEQSLWSQGLSTESMSHSDMQSTKQLNGNNISNHFVSLCDVIDTTLWCRLAKAKYYSSLDILFGRINKKTDIYTPFGQSFREATSNQANYRINVNRVPLLPLVSPRSKLLSSENLSGNELGKSEEISPTKPMVVDITEPQPYQIRVKESPNLKIKAFSTKLFHLGEQEKIAKRKKKRTKLTPLDLSFSLSLEKQMFPLGFNNLSVIEKEFIYHALTNNCFAKAFSLVDQNRQLIDYFADYLIRFQILRQHQILYLFSALLVHCKKQT